MNLNRLPLSRALAAALLALTPAVACANFLSGVGGAPTCPVFIGPAILNFDSATPGSFNSATYGNATFTGVDGAFTIGSTYIGNYNTNGVYSLQSNGNINPNIPILPSIIQVKFATPISAFAFNWGASDNTWRIDAYDPSNNLIETDFITTLTGGSNAGEYFGIAAPNIKTVLLTDQKDNYVNGDFILIDDFTTSFEVSAPEPGTALFLVIGGIALLRCRCR
jgi:hypothetical protein